MKANHTNCRLCKKDVSWPCYNKHFFSAKHIEEVVKPVLLANKDSLRAWRKATTKSTTAIVSYDGDKMCYICFGCKTVKDYLPTYHLSECEHAQVHLDTLKKLIGEPEVAEVEVSSDEVEKLKAELQKAKDELKAANKRASMMDGFINQTLGKRYTLMTHEEMFDFMDHKITYIKYEEPEEEYVEEEVTLEMFLKWKEDNEEFWWDSPLYTYEMYLEDKETYTQRWQGTLSWKLSKWHYDETKSE